MCCRTVAEHRQRSAGCQAWVDGTHFAAAPRTAGVMAFVASGLDATVNPAMVQTIPAISVAKSLLAALMSPLPEPVSSTVL